MPKRLISADVSISSPPPPSRPRPPPPVFDPWGRSMDILTTTIRLILSTSSKDRDEGSEAALGVTGIVGIVDELAPAAEQLRRCCKRLSRARTTLDEERWF
ncbi:unnamed protein product [Pleuronectes platessa]|uniref:Uncharacterized protein n=1 Tax=Pleuronectes platessa TaxID=8262 RepID=A0A9N7Y5D4_PLEPL|nr:unnamed protein product [Pleuronectes platessa]